MEKEKIETLIQELDIISKKEEKEPNDIIKMAEIYLLTNMPFKSFQILKDYIEEYKDIFYYNKVMGLTLKALNNPVASFRYLAKAIMAYKGEKEDEVLSKNFFESLDKISLPLNIRSFKKELSKAIIEFKNSFDDLRQLLFIKNLKDAKQFILKLFGNLLDIEYFNISIEKDDIILTLSPLGDQAKFFKYLYFKSIMPEIENFKLNIYIPRVDFYELKVNDEKFYLTELKYKIEQVNDVLVLKVFDPFKKNEIYKVSQAFSDLILVSFIRHIEFVEKEEENMVLRDELEKDLISIIGKELYDKVVDNYKEILFTSKVFEFNVNEFKSWKPRVDIKEQSTNFETAVFAYLNDDDRIFEQYFMSGIVLGSFIFDFNKNPIDEKLNDLFQELTDKAVVLVSGMGYGLYQYMDLIIFDFDEFFEIVNNFFEKNQIKNLDKLFYSTFYQLTYPRTIVDLKKEDDKNSKK